MEMDFPDLLSKSGQILNVTPTYSPMFESVGVEVVSDVAANDI
jgi:hypothetical protein